MPRPSNTEQRREQIVRALLEVMAETGYERASVNAVARAAGLTPGLVHYHFGSKQEILLQLIEHLAGGLQERLTLRLEQAGDDPARRLRAFVDVHMAKGADADPQALACWVGIAAEAIRQPEVRVAYGAVLARELDLLSGLVREALRAGDRPTRQARSSAAAILAAIQGYYLIASAAPDLVPDGSAAPNVRRLVDSLLA